MKVFIDTSSLFKLYHFENDSNKIIELFSNFEVQAIYLSEITKIEFDSVVWKKYRKGEIDKYKVEAIIANFENDAKKFSFIKDTKELKKNAKYLISKYGKEGLRTLDAIQLASAISIKSKCNLYLTADILLEKLFDAENLATLK